MAHEGPRESSEGVIFRRASARKAKTRMVAFGDATEKVAGFLALPRDQRRHRAIIVVHEWWGLNEWVKEQAEKLAANGYVALAVDLYNGKTTAKSRPILPKPASSSAVFFDKIAR
jgi:dienelactone hydrolase